MKEPNHYSECDCGGSYCVSYEPGYSITICEKCGGIIKKKEEASNVAKD